MCGKKNSQLLPDQLILNEKLAFLSTFIREGIVIYHYGEIIMANDLFWQLFEYEQQDLVGQSIEILTDNDTGKSLFNWIENEAIGVFSGTGIKKNGDDFPMEIRLRKIQLEEELFTFFLIKDASDLVPIPRLDAEYRNNLILDTALDLFILADTEGWIVDVNKASAIPHMNLFIRF